MNWVSNLLPKEFQYLPRLSECCIFFTAVYCGKGIMESKENISFHGLMERTLPSFLVSFTFEPSRYIRSPLNTVLALKGIDSRRLDCILPLNHSTVAWGPQKRVRFQLLSPPPYFSCAETFMKEDKTFMPWSCLRTRDSQAHGKATMFEKELE